MLVRRDLLEEDLAFKDAKTRKNKGRRGNRRQRSRTVLELRGQGEPSSKPTLAQRSTCSEKDADGSRRAGIKQDQSRH